MKSHTRVNPRLAHLAELIDHIPIAMLTTVEADGSLTSRPMATLELDAGGSLWYFTDIRSAKVGQLRKANLSFTDLAHATYVSLSGRGEIDTDRPRIKRLWTDATRPWFPDGPDSPNLALLKFIPDAADFWDAPNSQMVRAFGAVASMVGGSPPEAGERGQHAGLSRGALAACGR